MTDGRRGGYIDLVEICKGNIGGIETVVCCDFDAIFWLGKLDIHTLDDSIY